MTSRAARSRPLTLLGVLASLALAGSLASPAPSTGAPTGVPTARADNPGRAVEQVLEEGFADPGLFVQGGLMHLYSTGIDKKNGGAFRASFEQPGGAGFTEPAVVMPQLPPWVGPRGSRHGRGETHMWAPHVWKRDVAGPLDYVMWFGGSRKGRADCVGMATASNPKGPFTSTKQPLRCASQGINLVDPAHIVAGGRHYLLYKRNSYAPNNASIWAVRVNTSGTKRKNAEPFRLVDGGPQSLEAPSMIRRGNLLYLFASRFSFDTCRYRTFVYTSPNMRTPFRYLTHLKARRPDGRLLCGPGGAEVAVQGAEYRYVFHAYKTNPRKDRDAHHARYTWQGRLIFTPRGKPYLAPAPG